MQQNNSDCPRVAQHALVLGSGGYVQSDPPVPAQPAQFTDSTIQPDLTQESGKSESTCLAPRASTIKEQGLSEAVAARIEAPQRSTRSVYEVKWTIFTKWCLSNKVDLRAPPLKAWTHKNIRHQSDWSKVSLYPSPSFLSKNQLAKEGPDSVAPVVIPALAPTLDKSIKSDRSLFPVRALRYYLDRTSYLRQNKELVFVSFKKGFKRTSPLPLSRHGSSRL